MKPLTFFFLLISCSVYSQVSVKKVDRSLAKVNEKLYACKYEVSNKEYTDFLKALEKENKVDLLTMAKIDSMKWKDPRSYNEPYVRYYHNHPAYYDYPVVTISHKAAELYCLWLTDEYNVNKKRKFKKVIFRLPTEAEWIQAAKGKNPNATFSLTGDVLKDSKGLPTCNYKCERPNVDQLVGYADITAPVEAYVPNSLGIYNMSGNVAEMISDKNLTKGGSWLDKEEFLKIESTCNYNGEPAIQVGFRYFMEIIEK